MQTIDYDICLDCWHFKLYLITHFKLKINFKFQIFKLFTEFSGLEKLGLLVHESPCSSKQVQEKVVCLVILCTLWFFYEIHVFTSLCTLCTKWNMLWKDEAMQWYFLISSRNGWKIIREKETQTLLPTVSYI